MSLVQPVTSSFWPDGASSTGFPLDRFWSVLLELRPYEYTNTFSLYRIASSTDQRGKEQ